MFTFLNTAILAGLAAVAIPVLIHLFTRQKSRVVPFSTLRFLKELQQHQIRRLKIRQILLLILRTLLILCLVLAFARPTLKSTTASSLEAGAKLTAVLILDNTMSMGRESEGRRLLDAAKSRALEVVDMLRPGDEVYLLHPTDPPQMPHESPRYNLQSVRDLINATELSYRKTDYVAALTRASEIMNQSTNINKEVYLIGDLQKVGFDFPSESNGSKLFGGDVKLFTLPVIASAELNLAVTEVTFANQILEVGKVMELQARIHNHSDIAVENRLVHLFVNGKRVGQNVVSLEPNAAAEMIFRVVPERTGFHSGYVLLEDDALLEDNRRYFSFHIADDIPVLLVGNTPGDTQYLKLALRPEEGIASSVSIHEITTGQFADEELARYEVVVLSNVPKFDHTATLKLQNFVKAGGGLMVFLGADVDLRNYNEQLHEKLSLPRLTESFRATDKTQFLSFSEIDYSHPIFHDVFEKEKQVESPRIRFAVNIESTTRIDRIIEYSNGSPFLFESKLQQGRILYMTTGLDKDWSDLALRGVFVPLVNRGTRYLAGTTSQAREGLLIGAEIDHTPQSVDSGVEMRIKKPDETEIKVKPEVAQGNYLIQYSETDQPGIYQLVNDKRVLAQWAVNPDPDESASESIEPKKVEEALQVEQAYVITDNAETAEILTQSRFGRELWKWFMVAALILIVLEMLLFREQAKSIGDKVSA